MTKSVRSTPSDGNDVSVDVADILCEVGRAKVGSATARHVDKLAGKLDHPADALPDPLHVALQDKPKRQGKAKRYRAGSTALDVDAAIGKAALDALWTGASAPDSGVRLGLVKQVLEAVRPRNELEGLLAAQMIGAHAATMECYRRAMIEQQTPEGRDMNLRHAAKASRTFATLVETLDRHRGKGGQQVVRVEHVHVYEGGQAIVGAIDAGGAGDGKKNRRKPHVQRAIAHAPQSPVWSQDQERQPVPRPCDDERPLPHARGIEPRRAAR